MNHNNIEIERKFLVKDDSYKILSTAQHHIEQGYLCKDPMKTVRIRIQDDCGFITIKSAAGQNGFSRFEWEREIDLNDAHELMALALPGKIEKIRYIIPVSDGLKWEVDEFHGRLKGRVLAEIELPSEQAPFDRLPFLGDEVTGNPAYYNSNM